MSQTRQADQPSSLLLSSLMRLTKSILPARQLDPLPFSSQQCASWRAMETNRADALITDPYAEALAGPVAMSRAQERGQPRYPRLSVRTRYFDDFATGMLEERAQLVLLGAGMDMRAYRLSAVTERTRVYEVDVESVISLKERLLANMDPVPQPRGALRRVRADVTAGWADRLCAAGFSKERKTVWLVEGLVYYLDQEQVDGLFKQIFEMSAPGSAVCFSAVLRLREGRKGLASMFKSAMPDPEAYLTWLGFTVEHIAEPGGPDANYGRWPPQQNDADANTKGATVYVTALKP